RARSLTRGSWIGGTGSQPAPNRASNGRGTAASTAAPSPAFSTSRRVGDMAAPDLLVRYDDDAPTEIDTFPPHAIRVGPGHGEMAVADRVQRVQRRRTVEGGDVSTTTEVRTEVHAEHGRFGDVRRIIERHLYARVRQVDPCDEP